MGISKPPELNNECLSHIFSYLPMKDLITTERVCTRWQDVCLRTRRKITIEKNDKHIFEQVLEKYGNTIITLHILNDINNMFELINKHCNNLRYLTIWVHEVSIKIIDVEKFPFLKNLKYFHFSTYKLKFEDVFFTETAMKFLENADNLKNFLLTDYDKIIDLDHEELYVRHLKVNDNFNLEWLFQNFLKLKKHENGQPLQLYFMDLTEFFLPRLKPIANLVTSIAMSRMYWDCFGGNGYDTLQFENLERLHLRNVACMNDEKFLIILKKCPNLQNLAVWQSDKIMFYHPLITNTGLHHIANLKELKSLFLEFDWCMDRITEQTLEFIASKCNKLEYISCTDIQFLSASNFIRIISLLPNLSFLEVGEKILKYLNECLRSVVKCVQERKNDVKLRIHFFGGDDKKLPKTLMFKEKSLVSDLVNDWLTITVGTGYNCPNQYYVDCEMTETAIDENKETENKFKG